MRARSCLVLLLAAPLPVLCAACGDDTEANPVIVPHAQDAADVATDTALHDASVDSEAAVDAAPEATVDVAPEAEAGPSPAKDFDRFCNGKPWNASVEAVTVGPCTGKYAGVLTGLDEKTPFVPGTLEMMKVIAPHPIHVTKLRAAFKGSGPVRLRLMGTYGRSYPGAWPDMSDVTRDLVTPIEVNLTDADPNEWIEFDVSSQGVFLLPTQHYMIVYEHLGAQPNLAVEDLSGEYSRALLIIPKMAEPYGLGEYDYRLELQGDQFCAWQGADRWFGPSPAQPFQDLPSARVAVSDLNGDGHDDVIVNDGNPYAFLGDGKGTFAAPASDPWPDARNSGMLVFGDLDNDGDEDAFAARYVTIDGDGDKAKVGGSPTDCNDADPAVKPGHAEVAGNGYDDDCDGVADDGTDTSDADADGKTIADGDCDDTRKEVYPGAPELLDSRDNDCDLAVDEDFVNLILVNDGKGQFTVLPDSGVEVLDPTTAAGFGDSNNDGKLDLYYGNWLIHYPDDPAVQDRFFQGNGDGTFTDRTAAAGLVLPTAYSCYGVTWNDYDNDGNQDIFVGNYHLYPNQLWKNQGDGTFVDVGKEVGVAFDDVPGPYAKYKGGHTYGADFGDLDNDGDLDGYIANLAHPRVMPWGDPSMFVINQGPPDYKFLNEREQHGFIYDEGDVNVAFGDFDNDMDLDVAIASLYTGHYSRLYRNDGNLVFTDVTYETGTAVHDSVSVVWADIDEDGDLDLLQADRAGAPYVHLFVNRAAGSAGWIELDLQGTTSNRDGVGARVTLSAAGTTQLREVKGGFGHSNTQPPRRVHFGLGSAAAIESLTVRWVGGSTETITGVEPGKRYRIVQGSGIAVPL